MSDERLKRAARAKQIAEDPLMVEAAEHIEAECWRLFKQLEPSNLDGLAQVKAMQYMHAKYAAFLRKVLTDGKIATFELDEKRPRPIGY